MRAFDILVRQGYLATHAERRGHPLYVSLKPFSGNTDLTERATANRDTAPDSTVTVRRASNGRAARGCAPADQRG
ncbi:MAG: hypothetical protein K0U84_03775 [Actinomycetia bacterium]|nr:hypothetical protein [Actinomycetes bacterium]